MGLENGLSAKQVSDNYIPYACDTLRREDNVDVCIVDYLNELRENASLFETRQVVDTTDTASPFNNGSRV